MFLFLKTSFLFEVGKLRKEPYLFLKMIILKLFELREDSELFIKFEDHLDIFTALLIENHCYFAVGLSIRFKVKNT